MNGIDVYHILSGTSSMNLNIDWDEVIDKKARGIDDYDLGEVQEVQENVVVTQKGILDKDKFYLTKRLVDRFDGLYLWFNITETEAQEFRRD
jgi:hypothetical protein